MTQKCKRCQMEFSDENEAIYHTLMYHREDWLKMLVGEFEP